MSMSAQRKAIQVLREELITVLSVTLEEAMRTLNQRFDEALAAMAQVDKQQLGIEIDDLDDEEMRSDDDFINDEPEEVESSSSSSSDADHNDELEDIDDDDDDPDEILCFPSPKKRGRTPRGKSKSKAKVPPAVHYKMKPQVGKRERKAPRRFSPSRVHKDADERESISDSSGEELVSAASNHINRLDRDQWNVVRRLSPEQRNRNPWWSRRVAVPVNQVRDGCGYQSENNQIPRMLWDAIAENPNVLFIDTLESRIMEKCGFCGHKKKCTHYITLSNGATYYIGRVCVGVAKAWLHLSRLLADARHVELEQVLDALSALETAHAAKAGRRQTPSATNKPK